MSNHPAPIGEPGSWVRPVPVLVPGDRCWNGWLDTEFSAVINTAPTCFEALIACLHLKVRRFGQVA
ncbi:unnamed protein product [Ascophyllum nodosum]